MRGNQCSGFGGTKDGRLGEPVIGDDPIPAEAHIYVFPTWREAIQQAQEQIGWAYERRRMVFQEAHAAGLTYREIGDSAGLSAAAVHKIARRQRAALNSLATTPNETPSRGRSED